MGDDTLKRAESSDAPAPALDGEALRATEHSPERVDEGDLLLRVRARAHERARVE